MATDITDNQTSEKKWFDLKLNRDLLDYNFDGYKLSLDVLPKYKIDLVENIDISYQNELKTSKPLLYQHIKLFGFHNHLISNDYLNIGSNIKVDQFKSLYYFDIEWALVKIEFSNSKRNLRKTSLKLEKNSTTFFNQRVNITMKFLSENLAIICDGCDMIYLCEVVTSGNQNEEERWNILFKYNLEQVSCSNSVIRDAMLVEQTDLDLLLMNIHEDIESQSYKTIISYLKFESTEGLKQQWTLKSCKKLNSFHTVPDYVSLTRGTDEEIVVVGSSLIKFLDENGQVIKEDENEEKANGSASENTKIKYEWYECGHDVSVFVNLWDKNVNKHDLKVNITDRNLEISYKNEVFLSDNLYAVVDKSETNWQIDPKEGLIEISLKKKETLMWSTLFKNGDLFGKYKDQQVKSSEPAIEEIKAPEVNDSNGEVPKKIFNINNDLEECDGILNDEQQVAINESLVQETLAKDHERMITEDDLQMIMYLDLKNRKCCTRSYVSNNKFLFQMQVNNEKSQAICLRHDVDGILWQAENLKISNDAHFTHIHTFLAFGYVQASKQNAKFQLAAPNFSFVCIIDTSKHVYIYKERSEVHEEAVLRNRKTGKTITHVSKQYVVGLESDKEIMGAYCSNQYIVVLFEDCVNFIQINNA